MVAMVTDECDWITTSKTNSLVCSHMWWHAWLSWLQMSVTELLHQKQTVWFVHTCGDMHGYHGYRWVWLNYYIKNKQSGLFTHVMCDDMHGCHGYRWVWCSPSWVSEIWSWRRSPTAWPTSRRSAAWTASSQFLLMTRALMKVRKYNRLHLDLVCDE